jgi:2-hydroxyacyl-CoA lyase 1
MGIGIYDYIIIKGMPFAIAAKAVHPEKQIVAIVGDSAFGFSAMEIETATR